VLSGWFSDLTDVLAGSAGMGLRGWFAALGALLLAGLAVTGLLRRWPRGLRLLLYVAGSFALDALVQWGRFLYHGRVALAVNLTIGILLVYHYRGGERERLRAVVRTIRARWPPVSTPYGAFLDGFVPDVIRVRLGRRGAVCIRGGAELQGIGRRIRSLDLGRRFGSRKDRRQPLGPERPGVAALPRPVEGVEERLVAGSAFDQDADLAFTSRGGVGRLARRALRTRRNDGLVHSSSPFDEMRTEGTVLRNVPQGQCPRPAGVHQTTETTTVRGPDGRDETDGDGSRACSRGWCRIGVPA
jgi:hypothetical protein